MGGASCKHERLNEVEVHNVKTSGIFWEVKNVTMQCQDCPKTFRIETVTGKITGHEYKKEVINSNHCKHVEFNVDESTISDMVEEAGIGKTLLAMVKQ
jgi:hypothetical protein